MVEFSLTLSDSQSKKIVKGHQISILELDVYFVYYFQNEINYFKIFYFWIERAEGHTNGQMDISKYSYVLYNS